MLRSIVNQSSTMTGNTTYDMTGNTTCDMTGNTTYDMAIRYVKNRTNILRGAINMESWKTLMMTMKYKMPDLLM